MAEQRTLGAQETETHEQLPLEIGGEPFHLHLRRYRQDAHGKKAVLILHGGNSSSDTFVVPNGGVARFLYEAGWDVWLLDWRGSPFVQYDLEKRFPSRYLGGSAYAECLLFNYDTAAETDVELGLRAVRERIGNTVPLSMVGHCVAGGVTSMAITRGILRKYDVRKAVLVALSLFFEVPWDGWLKAEDYLLERIIGAPKKTYRSVDPRNPEAWPEHMTASYRTWPCPWFPDDGSGNELLQRITFMIGKPWTPELLVEGLDGKSLEFIFGPMHLGLYLHSGQMVRRGFAAPLNQVDLIDRVRQRGGPRHEGRHNQLAVDEGYFDGSEFKKMESITLLTGSENRVWHRDSLDLMYDWLRGLEPNSGARFKKRVVPGFGLQDLFWSREAEQRVWPRIAEGL